MSENTNNSEESDFPESGKTAKISRGALSVIGVAVPFAGGIFSAKITPL